MTKTSTIISAAFLILAAGQTGCSRSDDAQAAVRQAARDFEVVPVGNANSTDAERIYRDAEALNAKYAGSENGYTEAAAIAVAEAKIGQASLASQEASKAEGNALRQGRVIRGHINEWLTMSAIAQAAGTFNPAEGLKEVSELISYRQDDIASYRTEKEIIDADIASLESKIADLESNAHRERNAGAEIELQIPNVTATQGAALAERVREHMLRGDQFGLEAVRIQGRVDQLRPSAEEITLNVLKAESQIELLEEARAELQERERTSNADASEARASAQAAQDAITRLGNELEAFRSSEVDSANSKAISLARAAIASTRDAKSATASIASMTRASAMQILAECLGRQATGHAEAEAIYSAIAEAGIPGDWTAKAESEREQRDTAESESLQNYQDAASALRGARATGEEGDKVEAAAARLDLLGGLIPEPEYDDEISDEYEDEELEEDPIDDEPVDEEAETEEDDG